MSLRSISDLLGNRRSRPLIALALTTALAGGSLVFGQDERDRGGDRGGFRGFGGFSGGPPGGGSFRGGRGDGALGQLTSENARLEVGITPDQQAQIDKLNEDRRAASDQMRTQFDFRNTPEDQRAAMFEEMRKAMEKQQADSEAKLKTILKPEQFTRLQQISLHRSGPSALLRDELAAEFKLTDDQKAQLQKAQEESRDRFREMFGRGTSSEDRDRIRAEIEAKYLAVLTPAQQQQWRDKIGPAPKELGEASRAPVPFLGGPGGTPVGPPRAPRPEAPVVGPVALSFDRSSSGETPVEEQKPFSFRFNGAPWDDVLELFAKKAGLTLDIHDTPPGTFTYFDNKQYTPTEALDVINRHLQDRGFILIRRDNSLVSYNFEATPISPNLIPNVTVDELQDRGEHELLSLVLPIQVGNVEQVAKDLELLKGPQGSVKAITSTNTIVVTDLGTNLRRIANMVKDITPPSDNGLIFKSYRLQYIAAEDAEQVISNQLGVAQAVPNVSSSSSDRRGGFGFPPFGGFDRGRDDRGSSSSSQQRTTTATPTPSAKVQADTRLNNLFVTATPAQHKVVELVLLELDVDDGTGRKAVPSGSNKKYLDVYHLKSADVRDVARSLEAIMGTGIVVNEDGDTDMIHIMATAKQHEQVRQHISLMDGLGGQQEVAVIPLAKMDPTSAMQSLRAVFTRDGSSAPTIEPDTYGRQLIVRATPEQMIQIRKVLEGLGEDGTGRRPSQSGTLRSFNLQGRDVDSIMQMTQQMWGPTGRSRIRIVTPQSRGAVNGIRVPSQRQEPEPTSSEREEPSAVPTRRSTTPGGRASYEGRPGSNVARMMADMAARESQSLTSAPAAPDDASAPEQGGEQAKSPEAAAPSEESPITITQIGDQLILQSKDEAALNRLEDILQQSLEYVPPNDKPTIFILQSADPVETANMLVAMFPELSLNSAGTTSSSGAMSSVFSGVQSFGSDLWSASGMSSMGSGRFQVIPNSRLNALFVYGPPHKVAEVEEMIEVLDATDWPESGRSRRPRMIELEHADVNEVYTIVKDVYADYLESESSRQNQNPLAALAGGGRGGNNREATPPRMTLGIERNSSKLIVSASDELFNQVLALVESLDSAALDAQRTVRVVQIKNADATTLQNTLQQIVPKVTPANTSRSNSGAPSGGGDRGGDRGSSNGSNGSSGSSDDARRQQMMQMFGGGSGSPFSSRGGFSPFGGSPFGGSSSRGGFSPFGGRSFGGDRGRGR
ncbi:Bacterial type II/III secretion system short domain protein [Caulifigura coniformis]|uniref:Bacterial type II/III secretion system short domain protein n=1 Tax=Caulifigura coniformis TaxID=2527983 RepID=A0A517SEH6_9PLAN|nr:secretin N-terminal domain-containing protein [Caulifigura coniformis]QDT54530.1 Bacterial type II/III secretion system short domain protein [Caulifigura coniformis]